MNPFKYSLAEVSKALVALVGVVGFAVLYLANTGWDPGLVPALQTLVPPAIAVVAVFAAKNHTADDLNKALLGVIAAGAGVWKYFGQVDESTIATLGIVAGYIATFVGVYWKPNKPAVSLTGGSAAPPSVAGG